jgi:hypothetical protein
VPEWLAVICMVFMWAHGFIYAWAWSHRNEPFWDSFLNPLR